MRKFSAAVFAASGEFDRAHVFYNGDLINNFIILGGAAQLKLQRGCKTYADEPDATLENSCTAVYDGYAIATVNSIGYAYNTAT